MELRRWLSTRAMVASAVPSAATNGSSRNARSRRGRPPEEGLPALMRQAREDWRKTMALRTITQQEARDRIAEVLERHGQTEYAAEFREHSSVHAYLEIETPNIFGSGVSVGILEGGGRIADRQMTYRVEIGWSSTNRTVAQATATLANYQKALALAAEVEAVIQAMPPVPKES